MTKILIDRATVEQALEALEHLAELTGARWALEKNYSGHLEAISALRAALAEQPAEQEPVAWMTYESKHRLSNGGNCKGAVPVHKNPSHASCVPLYTAPQPRREVELTDEEIDALPWVPSYDNRYDNPMTLTEGLREFARSVIAAYKEKNT